MPNIKVVPSKYGLSANSMTDDLYAYANLSDG